MTDRRQPTLADVVRELTRTHHNREPYTGENGLWLAEGTRDERFMATSSWTAYHETTVPSLVRQLLYAAPSSQGADSGRGFTSRPTAHVEAVDTLVLIDDEASRWVKRLGEDDPGDTYETTANGDRRRVYGSGTIACIQLLHGLQASAPKCRHIHGRRDPDWCCTRHHIEADLRRWRTQARIVSGWDLPAFRPRNTCPVCDHLGGLRVHLGDHTALCIECRETWDQATIGLLAEHIRAENGEAETA